MSGERSLACIGCDLEKMSALRTQTGTRRGENRRIAGQGNAEPDDKYIIARFRFHVPGKDLFEVVFADFCKVPLPLIIPCESVETDAEGS